MKKTQILRQITFCAVIALILGACDGRGKKVLPDYVPASKSAPCELLVVIDNNFWDSSLGDSIREALAAPMPALPQSEPMFRLMHVSERHFNGGFLSLAGILRVKIDTTEKKTELGTATDIYARPQLMVRISAPDERTAAQFVGKHKKEIANFFIDFELTREASALRHRHNAAVAESTQKMFGLTANVPEELRFSKTGKDFLWASSNSGDKEMNFCMYATREDSAQVFNLQRFVTRRDSVMKANIPGVQAGQWMATASEEPLLTRTVNIGGQPAFEVRGLWEMTNDAMGGPFVSLVQWDSKTRRVVTTEGFIYSPGSQKRNLMRRMEGALRTIR